MADSPLLDLALADLDAVVGGVGLPVPKPPKEPRPEDWADGLPQANGAADPKMEIELPPTDDGIWQGDELSPRRRRQNI